MMVHDHSHDRNFVHFPLSKVKMHSVLECRSTSVFRGNREKLVQGLRLALYNGSTKANSPLSPFNLNMEACAASKTLGVFLT